MARPEPDLAVVVLADRPEAVDALAGRLTAQAPVEIELVVVGEPGALPVAGGAPRLVPVEIAVGTAPAAARAAGVRVCRAPYVFLGEPHALPCAGWAGALLATHGRGAACVVPTFVSANAPHAIAEAAFLLAYGTYADEAATEPRTVPAYNCSWRRSLLVECDSHLERLVTPGSRLGSRLARANGGAARAREARVEHLNATRLRVLLTERLLLGRVVGAERARDASRARRLAWIAAAPLVGPLLVVRALRGVRLRRLPPATIPLMLLAATAQALGEALGAAAGGDDADRRLAAYEAARAEEPA
jgi:hypothetical protein